MRKPATLMAGKFGSRDFGTTPYLGDALRLTGKSAPIALYIGAASGDHRQFGAGISGVLEAAGAQQVLWPKLTGRKKERARAREALESSRDIETLTTRPLTRSETLAKIAVTALLVLLVGLAFVPAILERLSPKPDGIQAAK